MTLSKKGSRPIHVDGYDLRWRYVWSGPSDFGRLVVQGEGKGQLRVAGPYNPDKGYALPEKEIVTPAVVEKWVRFAIDMKWDPKGSEHYSCGNNFTSSWLNKNEQAGPEIPGFVPENDPTPRLTRPNKPST